MDYFKKEPNIYFSSEIQLRHVFFGYLPKKTKTLYETLCLTYFH
jgi:hypothetical protein